MHTAALIDIVSNAGGFATRRQLRQAGATDRDLTRAVRSGDLHRPRLGWYSNLPLDDDRVTAVRVGGRLTGASALFHLGGWMWARPGTVCVSVAPHAARLRRCRRSRVVWDPVAVRERGGTAVVTVADALVRAVLEEDFEIAVALCDWALSHERISADEFADVIALLPADARRIADWVDADSDSILESVVRTRLRKAGFHVTSQVPVGFGRHTDLVVNGVLGIETDGRKWHADRFDADVSKDMATFIRRRIPVHLSYELITGHWDTVQAAIEAAVLMHRDGTAAGPVPPARLRVREDRSAGRTSGRGRGSVRARRAPLRAGRRWRLPRRMPDQVSHSWSRRTELTATPRPPARSRTSTRALTRHDPAAAPGHTGHDHRTGAKDSR
ncbi:type IV toxin-antitoxin system AbiEi family antitoxin domain-containing protein [Frigoribacterium sp. ACAM 257]|uniref:type IV toxin-antitoxin system AbiEi family antitoxin domain-containing protein n=1 Tax=Frigoribacterium sp. ACAM 257 TaxID=2508998 RepID=UPI0011BA12E0|nr:type IV toxin-antitoxin system AbiEi family antitoxin domain-containing protein [Frigoribacterium sp. ACAM 257]TWX40020.1 type IV toxin-antitoxin system AbiEi family antitoxin domain-containing protein [Frigoribacterium sp. ACAM 257]